MASVKAWEVRRSMIGLNHSSVAAFEREGVGKAMDTLANNIEADRRLQAYHLAALASVLFHLHQQAALKSAFRSDPDLKILRTQFSLGQIDALLQLAAFFIVYEADDKKSKDTLSASAAFARCMRESLGCLDSGMVNHFFSKKRIFQKCLRDAKKLADMGRSDNFTVNDLELFQSISRRNKKVCEQSVEQLFQLALAQRSFSLRYGLADKASSIRFKYAKGKGKPYYETVANAVSGMRQDEFKKHNPDFYQEHIVPMRKTFDDFIKRFRENVFLDKYYGDPDIYFEEVNITDSCTLGEDIQGLAFSNFKCQLMALDEITALEAARHADDAEMIESITQFRQDTQDFVVEARRNNTAMALPIYQQKYTEHFAQNKPKSPLIEQAFVAVCTASLAFVLGASVGFAVGFCLGVWTGPGAAVTAAMTALYTGTELAQSAIAWTVVGSTAIAATTSTLFSNQLSQSFFHHNRNSAIEDQTALVAESAARIASALI